MKTQVAIIGAGPSGLLLGQLLFKARQAEGPEVLTHGVGAIGQRRTCLVGLRKGAHALRTREARGELRCGLECRRSGVRRLPSPRWALIEACRRLSAWGLVLRADSGLHELEPCILTLEG